MRHTLLLFVLLAALRATAQITDQQYAELWHFAQTCQPSGEAIPALQQRIATETHTDSLFLLQCRLGVARYQQVQLGQTDALDILREAERYLPTQRTRGAQLAEAMWAYYMGANYLDLRKHSEAEVYLMRAYRLVEDVDGSGQEDLTANVLRLLQAFYFQTGVRDKELYYATRLKELYEERCSFGPEYINILSALANRLMTTDILRAKMLSDICVAAVRRAPGLPVQKKLQYIEGAILIYTSLHLQDEVEQLVAEGQRMLDEEEAPPYVAGAFYNAIALPIYSAGDYATAYKYTARAVDLLRPTGIVRAKDLLPIYIMEQHFLHDDSVTASARECLDDLVQTTSERFTYLSLQERANMWSEEEWVVQLCQFAMAHTSQPATADIYNAALFAKGLLLRASSRIQEAAQAEGGTLSHVVGRMADTRERLLRKLVPQDSIQTLRDSLELWDKYLTRHVSGYLSPELLKKDYDWQRVAQSLTKREAAVEFVSMPDTIDPQWAETPPQRYYALIARRGMKEPQLVPLCTEKALADQLDKDKRLPLQKQIGRQYTSNGSSRLYHGQELYRLLWAPVDSLLKGVRTVYFSPVGLLNRVAFTALNDSGQYIRDRYALRQLTSTKEVDTAKDAERKTGVRTAYVCGGVDYDGSSYNGPTQQTRGIARGGTWNYLPGTEVERRFVSSALLKHHISVISLDDTAATEESFKQLAPDLHDLIHLATHGFYLTADRADAAYLEAHADDPLMRSGIMLAGGNRAWTGHDVIPDIEDGILTAREITNIDLRGTRLIVLSACETGLGDINGSEGVFGLQRALKQAGVEAIVMSLWQVSDQATDLLMRTFYNEWLKGRPRHEAFQRAVEAVRAKEEFASPYFWAPFVMLD